VWGSVDDVRLMCREELVATHHRDWGREQIVFDPVHYLALLERKPGAFDFAKPLAEWHLPEPFAVLRRRFESAWGASGGVRHFIQVLRLLEKCSQEQLTTAIAQSLSFGVTTSDGVRVILEQSRETPVPLFSLNGRPQLTGVHVPSPDLTAYRVLQGGAS
jgi:hypothetical protein